MEPVATTARYGSLPFREQIQFFQRKLNVNTQAWTDVFAAQHDVAFMVAGANKDDLVADFREAIRKAIEDGATLQEFRRDFDLIVAKHGWDYEGGRNWRSRVIYETNLRQSYNAGRWEQLQSLKSVMPYWRYRHSDAVETPRPLHVSWDGLILSADVAWWQTHFPANGWGCQCYVEGLSERDMKRLGKTGPDQAPAVNMQSVSVGARSPGGARLVQTPEGIDPGFGYAPGRSASDTQVPLLGPELVEVDLQLQLERAAQNVLEKAARLPAETAAESVAQMMAKPRPVHAIDAGFAEWQATVAADSATTNSYLVGALEPRLVRSLAEAGVKPVTATIRMGEAQVLAALEPGGAVTLADATVAQLPALLRSPAAVLLDRSSNTLVYVAGADLHHAVVAVQYRVAGQAGTETLNTLASSSLTVAEIRSAVQAGRLQLLQGSLG